MNIKSLDFILWLISLLSYNSLNLFIPLLILVHLLLIVGLGGVGDKFVDVGLFTGLCSFVLEAPVNNTQDMVGIVTDPQSIS